MFGHCGRVPLSTAFSFVSKAAYENDIARRLRLEKQVVPVHHCRTIGKKDLMHNQALPHIEVDPETYVVTADGQVLTCEPARVLPLAQRYFLF
jgi:urease subunit alpha